MAKGQSPYDKAMTKVVSNEKNMIKQIEDRNRKKTINTMPQQQKKKSNYEKLLDKKMAPKLSKKEIVAPNSILFNDLSDIQALEPSYVTN